MSKRLRPKFGPPLPSADINAKGAAAKGAALKTALRLLKARPRASFELAERLARRGYPSIVVNSVLERLTKAGLLDDARFARDWLRWRDRTRPSGRFLLERELSAKGLTPEVIASALASRETPAWLAEIDLPEDDRPESAPSSPAADPIDRRLAQLLAAKQAVRLTGLPRLTRQRRLLNLLQRRGFSAADAYCALKEVK